MPGIDSLRSGKSGGRARLMGTALGKHHEVKGTQSPLAALGGGGGGPHEEVVVEGWEGLLGDSEADSGKRYASPTLPVLWLLGAFVCGLIAVLGGEWFMNSEYVSGSGSEWAQYDGGEFFGLLLQSIFFPASTVCLLCFAFTSFKSAGWPASLRVIVYLCVIVLLVTSAVLASEEYTAGVLTCLASFCVNGEDDDDGISPYITTVAIYYVFTLVAFTVGFAFLLMLSLSEVLFGGPGGDGGRGGAQAKGGEQARGEGLSLRQPLVGEREGSSSSSKGDPGGAPFSSSGQGFSLQEQQQQQQQRHVVGKTLRSLENQRLKEQRQRRVVGGALTLVVLFPATMVASFSVGDGWLYATQPKLKAYASSSVSDSVGLTWNLKFSDSYVWKIYGDILMYWLFVYGLVCFALASHVHRPLRAWAHRRVSVWPTGGWSVGELFFLSYFGALLVGELNYWYFRHGWEGKSTSSYTSTDRMSRTLGQLGNLTMGALTLPTTRHSAFQPLLGLSWEAMAAYHRWLGRLFLGLIFAHMACWWKVWAEQGYFSHDFPIAIPMYYHSDNFTVPLATLTFWTLLITHGLLALKLVRRRHFEVFYYAHHFFLVLWLVMLWHAQSCWYYTGASLVLYALDRAMRFSSGLRRAEVVTLSADSDTRITRLAFTVASGQQRWPLLGHLGPLLLLGGGKQAPLGHDPGQFVFINVPAISALESHPFTVSSSPGDGVSTLHIKAMGGDNTFTRRLLQLALSLQSSIKPDSSGHSSSPSLPSSPSPPSSPYSDLIINVEGPYGLSLDYSQFESVVFVAGGIGVTPCHSSFRYLYHLLAAGESEEEQQGGQDEEEERGSRNSGSRDHDDDKRSLLRSVSLVWMVKEEAMLETFAPTLSLVAQDSQGSRFSTDLYVTQGASSPSLTSTFRTTKGRPDLSSKLAALQGLGQRALVFVCGPEGLRSEVAALSARYGLGFHGETFEL